MKKVLVSAIILLTLLLIPISVTAAVADGTELYHYHVVATSYNTDVKHVKPNSTQGWLVTNYMNGDTSDKFKVLRIYNNSNAQGGLPEGETMTVDFPSIPDIDTSKVNSVHLKLKYCYIEKDTDLNIKTVDRFQVWISTDNKKTWKSAKAGYVSHEIIGYMTTADNRQGVVYEVVSEDLASFVNEGEIITDIRLKPYGDYTARRAAFRVAEVDVIAYDKPILPREETVSYISIPGDTLRQIVIAQATKVATTPWMLNKDVKTMNYTNVGAVQTELPMKYYGGYLHRGPLYTRVFTVAAEQFYASIPDGVYNGPYTADDAIGMDCSRLVIDAYTRIASGNTTTRIEKMLANNDEMPLIAPLSNAARLEKTPDVLAKYTEAQIYEHYANAHRGDFAITCPDNLHVRVLSSEPLIRYKKDGSIDPKNSYILMTEAGGVSYYYWETSNGSIIRSTDDPNEYKKSHPTYKFLYGASCRVNEKYTFESLIQKNYVIATLEEYHAEKIEELVLDAKVLGDTTKIKSRGLYIGLESNYRLISVNALIMDSNGKVVYDDMYYVGPHTFDTLYHDTLLDAKIKKLSKGTYTIALDVVTGPVTTIGGEVPVNRAIEFEYTV